MENIKWFGHASFYFVDKNSGNRIYYVDPFELPQTVDLELQARFKTLAQALSENEAKIVGELNSVQGRAVDIGGYYSPDSELASKAMRPSSTFNQVLNSVR